MRKVSIITTTVVALIFASTASGNMHIFWLSGIAYSGFKNVSTNVYVDPVLSKSEFRRTLVLLNKAKERIKDRYGAFTANPVIIVTGTSKNAKRYGLGDSPGKAFAAPWDEYVVVNYQTDDVNVVAHELMHAQVRKILGYWVYQTRLPTWFDEGVAMQVDDRDRYQIDYASFSPLEIRRVKTLKRPSEFWSTDKKRNIRNYKAAKAAVHKLLRDRSPRAVYSMLHEIREGEKFESVLKGRSGS
jgi:hypothetical protein